MSFNANDINLSNYEEYFILYMDNELNASQKAAVENFISLHPHLAEELQLLMSTKLPAEDDFSFEGKEELLSPAMKMSVVDEKLLLFIDNELPAHQKTAVEEKVKGDKDYALQYAMLMQTKPVELDVIPYPNKKELYRHEGKVVRFGLWMRVAVAVIIILLGSLFFAINSGKTNSIEPTAKNPSQQKPSPKNNILPEQKNILAPQQKEEPVIVQNKDANKSSSDPVKNLNTQDNPRRITIPDVLTNDNNDQSSLRRDAVALQVNRAATQPSIDIHSINNNITIPVVTKSTDATYNNQNSSTSNPEDWAVVEKEKKTKGKGFLRKVSRFIERNTGIGTVNADNELLVGAVALKLK